MIMVQLGSEHVGKQTRICGLYKICQAVTHIRNRVCMEADGIFCYDVLKYLFISLDQDLVITFGSIFASIHYLYLVLITNR